MDEDVIGVPPMDEQQPEPLPEDPPANEQEMKERVKTFTSDQLEAALKYMNETMYRTREARRAIIAELNRRERIR
jgi:hypothetical protein